MATDWDTWQLCTSVYAKPEVGISPRSLCGGPWVNVYNIVRRISRPYSPDLAPCDFFLFPQLKKTMKGRRFDYFEDSSQRDETTKGYYKK